MSIIFGAVSSVPSGKSRNNIASGKNENVRMAFSEKAGTASNQMPADQSIFLLIEQFPNVF